MHRDFNTRWSRGRSDRLDRLLRSVATGTALALLWFFPCAPIAHSAEATSAAPAEAVAEVVPGASPRPPAEALIAAIPFNDSEQNRVYIDVAPEGQRPFELYLDTGASGSVLTPLWARKLGVSIRKVKSSPYRKKTRLGRDLQFWVDTQSSDSASRTGFEYGLLGGDFLREYIVEFDFQNQIVRFYNPKKFKLPKQVAAANEALVPISIQGNRPFVKVEINGKKVSVLIDTGDPYTLNLSGKAAKKVGIDVDALSEFGSMGGVFGETPASLYEATSLRLGPFAFEPTPVVVTPAGFFNQGGNTDSALGYDLLQQYTIRIDYRRARMWLRRESEKVTYAGVDYALTRPAGLLVFSRDGQHYVWGVMSGSPAERLGLRRGDTIMPTEGEGLEGIIQRVVDREEMMVARTNSAGITYDLVLPNDEWLGDVSADSDDD